MRTISIAVAVTLLAGCSTTLSAMQTAVPVERGHVEVTGGAGVYLPMGPLGDAAVQGGKQLVKGVSAATTHTDYELTESDAQTILNAGISLATMPPGVSYELMIRTGLFRDLDVGVRWSTGGTLRADTKYRFYHRGPEGDGLMSPKYDLAVGFAASRDFEGGNLVLKLAQKELVGDWDRWGLEVPAYFSIEWGEILKFWVSPKYVFSRTDIDEKLVGWSEEASKASGYDVTLPGSIDSHFFGASVGIGAGYKWVHLMLELTAGYTYCRPQLMGQQRNLGGLTLYPAVGLDVKL